MWRWRGVWMLWLLSCGNAAERESRVDLGFVGDDPNSGGTRSCVAGDGTMHVVWADDRDGVSRVWMNSTWDGGGTWREAPVRVDRGDGPALAPDIACEGDEIYVVWEDGRASAEGYDVIYFSRSSDRGVTWLQEDVRLTPAGMNEVRGLGPRVSAIGDQVAVTWAESRSGAYDIYVAGSENRGVDWHSAVRLDGDPQGLGYSGDPQIAVDGLGKVLVVWEDTRDGLGDIYAAPSVDHGESFAFETRLDVGDALGQHESLRPRMSTEGGVAMVVWQDDRNGAGRDVYLSWTTNYGVNWASNPVRVDSDFPGMADSIRPSIQVIDGRGVVAWEDARGGGYDIFVRRMDNGLFPEEELRLGETLPGVANSGDAMVVGSEDDLVVVWSDYRGDFTGAGHNDLYYAMSRDGGASWRDGDYRLDAGASGESVKQEIGVHLYGDLLMAAWTDDRNGTRDIYATAVHLGSEVRSSVEE